MSSGNWASLGNQDYDPNEDSSDSDASTSTPIRNFNFTGSDNNQKEGSSDKSDISCEESEGCVPDSGGEPDVVRGEFSGAGKNEYSNENQPITKTKLGFLEACKLHSEIKEGTTRESQDWCEDGKISVGRGSCKSASSYDGPEGSSPDKGTHDRARACVEAAVQEIPSRQCIYKDELVEKECKQPGNGTDLMSKDSAIMERVRCDSSSGSSSDDKDCQLFLHSLSSSSAESTPEASVVEQTPRGPLISDPALMVFKNSADSYKVTDEILAVQNVKTNTPLETKHVHNKKTTSFKDNWKKDKQMAVQAHVCSETPETSTILSGQSSDTKRTTEVSKSFGSDLHCEHSQPSHPADVIPKSSAVNQEARSGPSKPTGFRNNWNKLERKKDPVLIARQHEQEFVESLDQKLKDLSIKQLVDLSVEDLFTAISTGILASTTSFADLHSLVENSFGYLKRNALFWEKRFDDHVCLPDSEIKNCLENYKHIVLQIPQDIPAKLRSNVTHLVERYAKEYEDRNTEIRRMEAQAVDALTRKAVDYYSEEMKYVIGGKCFDHNVIMQLHEQISEETHDLFLKSAALKHAHWEHMYKRILTEKIDREKKLCISLNDNNSRFLDSNLDKIKEDSVKYYKISLDDEKKKREFNPKSSRTLDIYNDAVTSAHEAAMKFFRQEIETKIGKQRGATIENYQDHFQKEIDYISRTERVEILEVQRHEEQLVKQKELASRQTKSHPEDQKHSSGGRDSRSQLAADTAHVQKVHVKPDCSSTGPSARHHGGRLSRFAVAPLPTCELAIHFGLNRTLAGIYLPGTENFQLLADVENCLYFEGEELLAHKTEYRQDNGTETSFKSFILEHPINRVHNIHIKGKEYDLRIEDFISYLFAHIKWRVERQISVTFANCVVCVPQCLNDIQIKAIQDGAMLAGFSEFKIINDTNAIALDYAMKSGFQGGDIVAVNTTEGFIDAAYFTIENGFIKRKAISGSYFIPEVEHSWWRNALSLSYWLGSEKKTDAIKTTLKFKQEKKNKRDIKCDLSHLVIVGKGEFVNKIVSIMIPSYKSIDCVHEDIPIKGAAVLARLQDFKFRKFDDPVCKLWLECNPPKNLGKHVKNFKDYLLSPCTSYPTFPNKPTTTKGINLNDGAFKTRIQNFLFKISKELHVQTMNILAYAKSLRLRVHDTQAHSDLKMQSLQEIDDIITKIQNSKITEDTSNLKGYLECTANNFFRVTT